ncbi:hypothetical protein I7I50_01067 [Histoplasma capsulatum G186AR]|uniref:Uncharacterized protein n=1 Tax=Ajellomyces capsulatus TaxID=5037 RepID=A0A8H8D267_AJECA|nr:hypothetical protein I7I52_09110 [Histoplasma capsulatum]QSS73040.1 hypothetical protein I7I50_01067 [Histoplasma capsulatum G186AR]
MILGLSLSVLCCLVISLIIARLKLVIALDKACYQVLGNFGIRIFSYPPLIKSFGQICNSRLQWMKDTSFSH